MLIFDEVKVACQLVWNSRNQKLSGLAMKHNDLLSLNYVYQMLQQPHQTPKQTSYILQFLWRDLTSSYDIVSCSRLMGLKLVYLFVMGVLPI